MLEILLIPAAVVIAALLAGGDSSEGDSSDGDGGGGGGTPPQGSVCPRTGTEYDAALFPDPRSVQQELKLLGFATALGWTNIQGADWRKEVMRFQAIARSMALPGMSTAPPSAVDGIVGACTLIALADAHKRRLAGVWPFAIVNSTLGGVGGTASSGPSEQQISMALDGTNPWAQPAMPGFMPTEQGEAKKHKCGPGEVWNADLGKCSPVDLNAPLPKVTEANVVLAALARAIDTCQGELDRACLVKLAEQILQSPAFPQGKVPPPPPSSPCANGWEFHQTFQDKVNDGLNPQGFASGKWICSQTKEPYNP